MKSPLDLPLLRGRRRYGVIIGSFVVTLLRGDYGKEGGNLVEVAQDVLVDELHYELNKN